MIRAALIVMFAGCAPAETLSPPTESGPPSATILLEASPFVPTGERLWVASPDDGAVVAIDPVTLDELVRIAIPGAARLVWASDHQILVAQSRTSSVALVDVKTQAVQVIPVPCAEVGGMAIASPTQAILTCPWDDLVLVVNLTSGTVDHRLPAPGRPSAVVVTEGRIGVTASTRGLLRWTPLSAVSEGGAEWSELPAAVIPDRSLSQTDLLALAEDGTVSTGFIVVDNDSNRDRPASEGGYGNVVDGNPRIEPRIGGPCGGRYARFDGGSRVLSGPAAMAHGGRRLWIAHRDTGNVAVLDCRLPALDDERAPIAVFTVGVGIGGIVVAVDGQTAWVENAFDHSVARLELPANPGGGVILPALVRVRPVGPNALSEEAARGRRLFHDATNIHLTPSGVVTCATCHPGGGEDGLSWFLHSESVSRKLRRTPAVWNAKSTTLPFHWDSEFTSGAELVHATVRGLMDGDGLLVDGNAITAWMETLAPPRGLPHPDEALVALGRGEFEHGGCSVCHAGPSFVDGQRHAVLATSPDPDGTLELVDTPSLVAVRTRAPWLHDGRAASLEAIFTEHNAAGRHGQTGDLAIPALVAYLQTL